MRDQTRWLPVVAGVAVACAALLLCQALLVQERTHIRRTVELAGSETNEMIKTHLESLVLALVRMAGRWEARGGTPGREWESDAQAYVTQHPGYQAIEWVDPSFYIRWVVPMSGNESMLDLNLAADEWRRLVLEAARESGEVTVTRAIDLVQGGEGFLIYVPLYPKRKFDGFILGVFEVEEFLDQVLSDEIISGYSISIFDEDEEIYRRADTASTDEAKWSYEEAVDIPGLTWRLRLSLRPHALEEAASSTPEVTLGVGLVLALLLGMTIQLAQKARHQTASLRESEGRYRLMAENATDLISRHTPEGVYAYASPASRSLLGYGPEELVGHDAYEFFHPEDLAQIERSHSTILERPLFYTVDYRIRRKDGQYIWFETTSKTIRDPETGEVQDIIAVSREITQRKEAEQALQKARDQLEERVEARTADLAREQELLQALMDASPDPIYFKDTDSRFTRINKAQADLLGVAEPTEAVGKTTFDYFSEAFSQESYKEEQEIMSSGKAVIDKDVRVRRKGEPERWYSSTKVPILDREGRVNGLFGITREITRRKYTESTLERQAEELLRANSELEKRQLELDVLNEIARAINSSLDFEKIYRAFMNQATKLFPFDEAAIWILSEDNKTLRRLGLSLEEGRTQEISTRHDTVVPGTVLHHVLTRKESVVRRDWSKEGRFPETPFLIDKGIRSDVLMPLLFQEEVIGAFTLNSRTPDTYSEQDFPLLRQIAGRLAIALRNARILDDLEDKNRALVENSDELARSNAELEQFAYVASHDLQEPLRMVTSYMQLLEQRYKEKLDSDAKEFIAFAVDGAARMRTLISDLLVYSRVGTRAKEPQPVDSRAALEEALINLKVAIEESGAEVTHDGLPTVLADDTQLVQLFQNLVGNAVKFRAEEPPRVHLSARKRSGFRDSRFESEGAEEKRPEKGPAAKIPIFRSSEQNDGEWVFSVRDNGIGIDPQQSDRIFQVFQRLHGRDEHPGTGIGLAICRKIVERHEGRIWVDSKPGKGSTFYFTMPLTGDE